MTYCFFNKSISKYAEIVARKNSGNNTVVSFYFNDEIEAHFSSQIGLLKWPRIVISVV